MATDLDAFMFKPIEPNIGINSQISPEWSTTLKYAPI